MITHEIDLECLKAVVVRMLDEAIKRNASKSFKLEHTFYRILDFAKQLDVDSQPTGTDLSAVCATTGNCFIGLQTRRQIWNSPPTR